MHHFSTRCVAALLCVHPVLSLCEKQLWEHVYVRFDLHSEEAHTNRVDAGWVNVHSHCEVTPLPVCHLSAIPVLAPLNPFVITYF